MKITNMKKLAAACAVCAVFAMLTGCGKYIGRNGMRSESTVQTSNIQTDSAPTESVNGTENAAGSDVSEAESKAESKKKNKKSKADDSSADKAAVGDITAALDDTFADLTSAGGTYSLCAVSDTKRLAAGNSGGENAKMISASLIKLYVAGAVYENADSVRAAESYSGETDELLSDMISQSSNDACNTLVTQLGGGDADKGMAAVNSFCEAHGYADTEMNRLMLDFNGKENYTSPADCCAIMSDYYSGKLAGAESVINYMRAQATRTKIPAGIPEEAEVANKTGELSSVENDSAIIFAPQGTFFLCIMTNGDADTAAARTDITQAAGLVYTEMTN